eukprot:XP_014768138.1 PREDICTED: uncharacterized protein LOC106867697 [Octopus bimaculoides]
MDNWFTSYGLVVDLLKNYRLTLVGTLRKNKIELPPQFVATRGRTEYTSLFGFQKDVILTSYVLKKSKMLQLVKVRKKKEDQRLLPSTTTKGRVDTVDHLCSIYNVSKNTQHWPVTVFCTMLNVNVAGINACSIFMAHSQTAIRHQKFWRELGFKLVDDHIHQHKTNLYLKKDLIQYFSAS